MALDQWVKTHRRDYDAVEKRLSTVRNVVMNGPLDKASRVVEKAYVFAVLSIKTERDRHERAFVAHYAGDKDLKDAALMTVYGGNKKKWISDTMERIDWEMLTISIRHHVDKQDWDGLLETVVDNLKGVSYRKGGFMLAMLGFETYMCIDTNVGSFANIDNEKDYTNAKEYMEDCKRIVKMANLPFSTFITQWSIYDHQRGEHARHMAYFREVLEW